MSDFLLELLSEEIPARMQEKAAADLARLFGEAVAKAGLATGTVETFVTPRRLALIARDLPDATAAVTEETKGPRASAPPQALDGFLRKTGLTREQLVERDGVLFAVVERPGRATADVLADAIPAIIRAFPWPKSMRWGAASASTESLRWVRPLQGVVAILGEDLVPVEVAGIASGFATVGHRFHHPGSITIGGAHDYAEKLRACHVIVDAAERQRLVREGAEAAAAAAGLALVPDEGLVAENAGLTEWPVPLLGRFDPAFLEVPREVIQLTMRTNQKYFACVDGEGALAPAFVCTANIDAADGGASIVAGNAKVLAARLSDARFFWAQDLKVPLEAQAEKLKGIVFHEKLGTVADKVERVAKLARWLVEEGVVPPRGACADDEQHVTPANVGVSGGGTPAQPHEIPASAGMTRRQLADMAEQAARLCKADLVTGMVGEFPELQGVMGGYYARAQGLPAEVADAIRDHYKPVGQGDKVPTAPVTVAVSLADKLDTLFGFFSINHSPTGSRDPYALRRAAIGVISLITCSQLRLLLRSAFTDVLIDEFTTGEMLGRYIQSGAVPFDNLTFLDPNFRIETVDGGTVAFIGDSRLGLMPPEAADASERLQEAMMGVFDAPDPLLEFLADRLKVQQREAGVRHDLIDAVFALGGEDDLVRLLARVRALQAFVETEDGRNLLAGYKRAANIVRIEEKRDAASFGAAHSIAYEADPQEAALLAALDRVEPEASAAVEREDFEGAMAALAQLRAPVDAFFDHVTVNDPDTVKRRTRLGLLVRIRDAVHRVADFSKIEG